MKILRDKNGDKYILIAERKHKIMIIFQSHLELLQLIEF